MLDQVSVKVSLNNKRISNKQFLFQDEKPFNTDKTTEDLVVWKAKYPSGTLIKGEKCPISGFWFWENIAKCSCHRKDMDDDDDYEDSDYDDNYDDYEDSDYYDNYGDSDNDDNNNYGDSDNTDYSFEKQKDFQKNKMYNDVFIL